MGRRDDRDRDDRPSWRDIDRKRDSSTHTEQNRPSYGGGKASNRHYKAALERVMKDKLNEMFSDPKRDKAAAKIQDAATQSERKEAAEAYLAEYDVPEEDFPTLMAMAEVKDDALFATVVPLMAALWDDQPDSRRKVARQLLQMRLMRVRDKDARAVATELIRKG